MATAASGNGASASPTLTDYERRILANLSVPRNPLDLTIRLSGLVDADPEQVDDSLRGDLTERRLVVNLGAHSDSGQLALAAADHADTMELPDEKARNYELEMRNPELRWQMQGDLWMLSNEGLAALHAPVPVSRGPLTPTEVQTVVDAEWARTLHEEFQPGVHRLANLLLEDEFRVWFDVVADECERLWSVRPNAPMAGGASGYSSLYAISQLDQENQKTAIGAVADPWYMALSILSFTRADTGTIADDGSHKPTYTGYARKSVAGTDMAGASGTGTASNTAAITFAACTNLTSVIAAQGNCSTLTLGLLRKWGDVTAPVTVSVTQTPPQFAISAYTTTCT